jgi:outer membrane protein TolC
MKEEEAADFIQILENQFRSGFLTRDQIYRTKLEIETAESQLRAAKAGEQNARYMLWSVIVAALSAVVSLAATLVTTLHH